MPNYVEKKEVGPLSYRIEKRGGKYRLWLNGCGIGRPRPDKPAGEIWEYKADTLDEARKELAIDARERLSCALERARADVKILQKLLASLE